MAQKRYYKDLKAMAKRANQRMVELEHRGLKAGAYNRVQGYLEMMGKKSKRETGRRFSETGKATYNEYQTLKKFLSRFLESKTSTVRGTKSFYDKVWRTANERMNLAERGITKDEYMEIWENLPDDNRDRVFGSDTIISMVTTALNKGGKKKTGEALTVSEIVEKIQNASNVKDAYRSIGITYKDVKENKSLGDIK